MIGIYRLVQLVIHLYEFSQQTHGFVQDTSRATEHEDAERAAVLRRIYQQIVRVVVATLIVGCVAVPCAAPWVGAALYGIKADDAAYRMLLGVIVSLGPAILYMFTGVSLGCLLAPSTFLQSPAGAKWMELIGTTNMVAARVVCGLVVVAGGSVMLSVAAFLISMAPTTR